MANINSSWVTTVTYPKTNGAGSSYNQVSWSETSTVVVSETLMVRDFTLTAGQTGVNILPAGFAAYDMITIYQRPVTSNADAAKHRIHVKRTDAVAVVHESFGTGAGRPIGFSMESGDTALTVDNVDGTNATVVTVILSRTV